jgi:hypothetical protein
MAALVTMAFGAGGISLDRVLKPFLDKVRNAPKFSA